MGELQAVLDEQLAETPRLLLRQLITEKLRDASLPITSDLVEGLTDHILAGNLDTFHWEDGEPEQRTVQLDFKDEEISNKVNKLLENLPSIIDDLSQRAAKSAVRSLRKRWSGEYFYQTMELSGFRERLEARWGDAFGLLRMLLTIAREIGEETVRGARRSRSRKRGHLQEILLRLHMRSCQVTAEIITLMENGFADGAMARWRTLYEIEVVATIVADGGEPVAECYVEHQAVETTREVDEYSRCYQRLGYRPVAKRIAQQVSSRHKAAIQKYGKSFSSRYGWASNYLGQPNPQFRDLEAAAGRAGTRLNYLLANHNVHAGPRRAFFQLGLLEANRTMLSGPSNAGFLEPGQNTAFTLTQITMLLLARKPDFDKVVYMRILMDLRDKTSKVLAHADRKLRRDDATAKQAKTRR